MLHSIKIFFFSLILLSIYLYFLFFLPLSITREVDTYDYNNFVCPIYILVAISFALFSLRKVNFKFIELFLFIIILLAGIVQIQNPGELYNEQFCIVIILFFLLQSIFSTLSISSLNIIWIIMLAIYFIEILILFTQWRLFKNTPNLWLNLTGTLKNSGIIASYVVIHLPILFYFISKLPFNKYIVLLIYTFTILLTFMVIFLTKSRTAMLAMFIVLSLLFLYKIRTIIKTEIKKKKKLWLSVFIIVLFLLFFLLIWGFFQIKHPSIIGRLVKWEITLDHIKDNFWFGTGLGKLSWYYPQ